MNGIGQRLIVIAAILVWMSVDRSWIQAASPRDSDYRTIIDRNPFGLKPAPPPPTNNPAASQQPKTDIKLTGITSFGARKAYFMVSAGKDKPEYYSLSVGEGKDGLEVLEIDDVGKSVKIRNAGIETLMTFASHGISAPSTGPMPASAIPAGTPGFNPAQPHPGQNPTAFNMPNTSGGALGGLSTVAQTRNIPSRVPRTDLQPSGTAMSDPVMAARYGLTPAPSASPIPNLPVVTAPVSPNPGNLSGEQQILMLELQRMATQKANRNAILPPTPGLPGFQ